MTPFTVAFRGLNPSSAYALIVYSDWKFSSGLRVSQAVGTGLTSLTYTVWTSSNLQPEGNPGGWAEDSGAVQAAGTPDSNGVQTVTVSAPPANGKLFVQVHAE